MLLSKSIAFSILSSLAVQGLVIPSIDQITEAFSLSPKVIEGKVDSIAEKLTTTSKEILNNLKIDLLSQEKAAPLVNAEATRDIIPHKYIVVFKQDLKPEEIDFHQEWVAVQHADSLSKIENVKDHSFFAATEAQKVTIEGGLVDSFNIKDIIAGYSGFFLDETIDLIRRNPLVAFVEKDSMVYANEFDVQNGSPWGLARISHRESLNLGSFNKYLYDDDAGEGVTAYVIDTGINVSHQEFKGRAIWGATIPSGDADVDGNGHGTHCAGTIASDSYGVAKKAEVVAVKVLRSNGSGSMSDVVKGVEFAAKSHITAAKNAKKGFKGSTANMSLGGGKSPALDLAVNAAVKAGLHFAVAAGNDNADACNYSPAAAENAITVGASTLADSRAYFSNIGKCVDIFAPGLNILSTYIGSTDATATLSGTSMASPHVCGLLSYYLSLQPGAESEFFSAADGISPAQLKKNIIAFGSRDLLTDIPNDGSPNILIYNGAGQNLTSFWGDKSSSVESKAVKNDDTFNIQELEAKIHSLTEGVVENLEEEIKQLVEKAYSS